MHRREAFRASRVVQDRALANPKIEVVWNAKVLAMVGNERGLTHLELENTVRGTRSQLVVTGGFIFVGFTPNTGLVQQHFEHDPSGYIITNDRMETSIPGLFAAGDLRVQLKFLTARKSKG